MIAVLAEAAQTDTGLSFKDFAVPVGVVFGAIIGAFVAWRNNRKNRVRPPGNSCQDH
jgi:hypothetical protein